MMHQIRPCSVTIIHLRMLLNKPPFALCYSATWPAGVRRLAGKYMTNPMQVFVGTLDLAACHSVTQRVEFVDEEFKRERLVDFLLYEKHPDEKCIVFVGRKTTYVLQMPSYLFSFPLNVSSYSIGTAGSISTRYITSSCLI